MPVTTISHDEYYGVKAQAFDTKPTTQWRCRARQLTPRLDLVVPGQAVAIDCEGVELKQRSGIDRKGLGRVTITREDGQILYDSFVYHDEPVGLPPKDLKLGVKWGDIKPENGAQPLSKVLAHAESVFDIAGLITGHAIHNDTNYLRGIDFSQYELRDTQKCHDYQAHTGKRQPVLAELSREFLGRTIQGKGHSSVEDARATMALYKLRRKQIDATQSKAALAQQQALWDFLEDPGTFAVAVPSSSAHVSKPSQDSGDTLLTAATSISTLPIPTTNVKLTIAELGRRVALPNLKYLAKGRAFDMRTSRYIGQRA